MDDLTDEIREAVIDLHGDGLTRDEIKDILLEILDEVAPA